MLKKYESFLKESRKSENYKFGCVLLDLEIPNWNQIVSKIEKEDIYEPSTSYGIENDTHLTILYGLHQDVSDSDVVSIINKYKYKKFDIEIDGITNFKNKEFEVVKLGVKNNDILQSFHDELSKLPNSNEFPDYIPHITISYVNLGSSDKYVNKDFKINNIKLNQIEYSKPNGVKLNFDLY